jgi:hypothetical protein
MGTMNRTSSQLASLLAFALIAASGCGSGPAPLPPGSINLVFVVSEDLTYNTPGDLDVTTANLTGQGLHRSLLMASYLKKQVLGGENVNRIFAVPPMTHLQNGYPDLASIGGIQQFAMLNQTTITGVAGSGSPYFTANSAPINVAYRNDAGVPLQVVSPPGTAPRDVGQPLAQAPCIECQGLVFGDRPGNLIVAERILLTGAPGFFVFSAPWETTSELLADLAAHTDGGFTAPTTYAGANVVYAVSISPAGAVSLTTYDAPLAPGPGYPALPAAVGTASCPTPTSRPTALFSFSVDAGDPFVRVPADINTNQTTYLMRHAEAHPILGWDDGNFVAAGQWRALAMPGALAGKINPTKVYSIDPAQVAPDYTGLGNANFPYVRPALTIYPYVVATGLPLNLVYEWEIYDPRSPGYTVDKFFQGGQFSGERVLLAWEHNHFPPVVQALVDRYYLDGGTPPVLPSWSGSDYDTIWTVTLDGAGNLTVTNALCEGIDSASLPETAPAY